MFFLDMEQNEAFNNRNSHTQICYFGLMTEINAIRHWIDRMLIDPRLVIKIGIVCSHRVRQPVLTHNYETSYKLTAGVLSCTASFP